MMQMKLYKAEKQYPDFVWPYSIAKAAELNLAHFQWWYILSEEEGEWRIAHMAEQYPARKLVPFAIRIDNDDVACFEVGHDDRVFVVHDFADPGWERRQEYEDFWCWMIDAVDELARESRDEERRDREA